MGFSPDQTMAIARIMTRKYLPYMSAAVMGLIPRKVPGLGTMAVSASGVLSWDPEWVGTLPLEQVAGVLLHEANHIISNHCARGNAIGAEPKLWNICADCEINDDLSAAKVPLPENGVWPKTYGLDDGKMAETYYQLLRQRQSEGGDVPMPSKPTAAGGWDGSGGGNPTPGEDATGTQPKGAKGDLPDPAPKGRSEADMQRIRSQVAQAIQDHVKQNGEGSVPAGYRVWADGYLKPPKVRWEDKLRRAIRSGVCAQAGMMDYTYQHRARRQAMYAGQAGQIILPALRAPLPQVGVGLDTSGSMMGDALMRAASEIDAILKGVRAGVQFIASDSEVHTIAKIKSARDFAKSFTGGGGTSFIPVFDALDRLKPRPPLFVFLTDGQGEAPTSPPPGVKVVWVLCGKQQCLPHTKAGPLGWGQVIAIDEDA